MLVLPASAPGEQEAVPRRCVKIGSLGGRGMSVPRCARRTATTGQPSTHTFRAGCRLRKEWVSYEVLLYSFFRRDGASFCSSPGRTRTDWRKINPPPSPLLHLSVSRFSSFLASFVQCTSTLGGGRGMSVPRCGSFKTSTGTLRLAYV